MTLNDVEPVELIESEHAIDDHEFHVCDGADLVLTDVYDEDVIVREVTDDDVH